MVKRGVPESRVGLLVYIFIIHCRDLAVPTEWGESEPCIISNSEVSLYFKSSTFKSAYNELNCFLFNIYRKSS